LGIFNTSTIPNVFVSKLASTSYLSVVVCCSIVEFVISLFLHRKSKEVFGESGFVVYFFLKKSIVLDVEESNMLNSLL
jgi:hypothetical protein